MMRIVGLTGGIASGKSTVASRWRRRGLLVLDADQIARDVVARGTRGLARIVAEFGPSVLAADGSLNRTSLAELVFADEKQRGALEAITQPLILEASEERLRAAERSGEPLACYEAALLIERGRAASFRPLVVVTASESEQVRRAVARGGVDEAQARARLAAQLPNADKIRQADLVIDNAGTVEDLVRQADEVLERLCHSLDVSPERYPRPPSAPEAPLSP